MKPNYNLCLFYMSFSMCLNSVDGTKVVGTRTNQIIYNFAFDKTPEHKGGYNVTMAFCSQFFNTRVQGYSFKDIYINADLGARDSYTPIPLYTGTTTNSLLGVARVDLFDTFVIQLNPATGTPPGPTAANIITTSVPANSDTVAHDLTTTSVMPTGYSFTPSAQTAYAGHSENPPLYLTSKPTNNQFLVTLNTNTGALHTEAEFLATNYCLLLSFEAV